MVKMIRGRVDWSWYGLCKTCQAQPGDKCLDGRKRGKDNGNNHSRYKDVPHPGRVKRDDL